MPGVKVSANIKKHDFLKSRRNKHQQIRKSKGYKPSTIDNKTATQLKKIEKLRKKIATKQELKEKKTDWQDGPKLIIIPSHGQIPGEMECRQSIALTPF
mmetsp:Transcript_4350/g.5816  ORF Transcript_4350/g.5816 Transcript_4350/m.5816 type:complete len:99 (-) Transcript_4350:28-324(-)